MKDGKVGSRKTGDMATSQGKVTGFAPVEDTPDLDIEYGDSRDAAVDKKKSHVPGMTDSD